MAQHEPYIHSDRADHATQANQLILESFHETKQNPTPLFKACLMPKTLLEKTDDQLSEWLIAMHWTQSSPWTPCPWSPGSLPMMSKICEFRISVFPKCRTEWTCRRPTWHCLLARALALAKPEAQTGSTTGSSAKPGLQTRPTHVNQGFELKKVGKNLRKVRKKS